MRPLMKPLTAVHRCCGRCESNANKKPTAAFDAGLPPTPEAHPAAQLRGAE